MLRVQIGLKSKSVSTDVFKALVYTIISNCNTQMTKKITVSTWKTLSVQKTLLLYHNIVDTASDWKSDNVYSALSSASP